MESKITATPLFLFISVSLLIGASAASYPRIDLIAVHQCAARQDNKYAALVQSENSQSVDWTPILTLDSSQVELKRDPDSGPNCYNAKVTTRASQDIQGKLQANVTMRIGGISAPPLGCFRESGKENSCGGLGSCLICDVCEGLKKLALKTDDGRLARCPIQQGETTIVHSFCMPDVSTFKALMTDSMKQVLRQKAKDTSGEVSETLWLSVEVYNTDVFKQCGNDWDCDIGAIRQQRIGCYFLGFNIFINAADIGSD